MDPSCRSGPGCSKDGQGYHQINRYPVDKYWGNQLRYPVGSDLSSKQCYPPLEQLRLKFEVIIVQPADLTSIQWAPILVLPFFSPFRFSFYRKCWLIVPTSSHQCHSQGRGHQRGSSHLIPNPPLFIKKKVERYPSLSMVLHAHVQSVLPKSSSSSCLSLPEVP